MLQNALKYISQGKTILPVVSGGKRPLAVLVPNGHTQASRDPAQTRKWWAAYSDANIGLVCSFANDLCVLDVDLLKGGEKSFANLVEKYGPLPETVEVDTGGGGKHYYFLYDDNFGVEQEFSKGIDIKKSGYVVAPPSIHESGEAYAFVVGRALGEIPIAWAPEWLLKEAVRDIEPSIEPELQKLINQYGEPYYTKKDGDVTGINQSFWASLHQAEHIQLFEPDERAFYRYNPESGLYTIISEDVIKQDISSRILEVSQQKRLPSLERKRTDSNQNHIVSQLKGISEKKNAFKRGNKFVHLNNGVIVFRDTGEADFCSFSPDFYSRNQCPIAYDASATCERFFDELLYPSVSSDDAILLQKYTGLCLLGNNLVQKLLILDGKPGRGKSTLALVIQSLIGQVNVTELRTRHLNSRFELFRYLKKSLLVGVDVPGQFLSEKGAYVIKGLVGGDWFDAEKKCGNDSFQFQGNFCMLITSNSRLQVRLDGDTGAWKRRLLIIRFEGPVPAKKIPDFKDVLIREEGSGILNWALQGLGMLLKDIEAGGDIKLTDAQDKIIDVLLAESDSLRRFLVENVVQVENADLSIVEIVEAYAEYCPAMGWHPKPITDIHRELESLMLELFGTSKSHSIKRDKKSARGFRRVSLKDKDKCTWG